MNNNSIFDSLVYVLTSVLSLISQKLKLCDNSTVFQTSYRVKKETKMRRKIKGFRMGKRILRVSRWIRRKTRIRRSGYNRIIHSTRPAFKLRLPIAKLKNWGRRLTQSFRLFGSSTRGSGYKHDPVPRGHLAVYVGQKDGDFHRVLVPVVYFNHPLFGELLRESEKEYGFCHEGGITIPCPYSDFEQVKTRIASGSGSRVFPWSRLCRN